MNTEFIVACAWLFFIDVIIAVISVSSWIALKKINKLKTKSTDRG